MAYNQFFPASYQQYQQYQQNIPYQQFQQVYPQQYQPGIPGQQIPANSQQPQQIQNGGFVSVRNIEEAFNWPVAPGNSITFKDENSPYVYTKTKGFSQLDQPIFEKYRLVKEEDAVQNRPQSTQSRDNGFDCEEQIKQLWDELDALKTRLRASESKSVPTDDVKPSRKPSAKKEVDSDDA